MKIKTKQKLIISISVILIVCIAFFGYWYFMVPRIEFKQKNVSIEIHESFTPIDYVSKVANAHKEDIRIKGEVDTKKLGAYTLTYSVEGKDFTLDVLVVDTKKPQVLAKEANISIDEQPDASIFIKEVKDATKTTSSFKETYSFHTLGDMKVIVLVKDEGGNVSEISTTAHVLEKDKIAPVLSGIQNQSYAVGTKVDLLKGVHAKDNRDGDVKVSVDKGNFNANKVGSYTINYSAKDRANNVTKQTAVFKILDKMPENTGEKIIYLTIDDGPSANTPKILDILDRYNVKATFFVTAQSPSYIGYIKTAYQKGHAIGLHTYSHEYGQLYANEAAYFRDLAKISDVVKQQTGIVSNIIRFPGGSSNTISHNSPGFMTRLSVAVREKGYQYYDWNSESGDGNSANPSSKLIATAKSFGGSGPLMMLTHDHAGSYSSVQALPAIIEYYKGLGYTFKTVDASVPGYHHGINN